MRIVHSVLHRSLEKAVRSGLIPRNPTDCATLQQYEQADLQVLRRYLAQTTEDIA